MKDNKLLLSFLFGVICGFLIAVGMRYPLEHTEYITASSVCPESKIKKIRLKASGKIDQVVCENGIEFSLDN